MFDTSIDKICTEVSRLKSRNVALQFPSSMLHLSKYYVDQIERYFDSTVTVKVLADNSYSECCIDEMTASHIIANDLVIIHFGHCCYNVPSRYTAVIVPPPPNGVEMGGESTSYGSRVDNFVGIAEEDFKLDVSKCTDFVMSKIEQQSSVDFKCQVFISDYFHDLLYPALSKHFSASEKFSTIVDVGKLKTVFRPCCAKGDFGRYFENLPDSSKSSQNNIVIYFGESNSRLLELLCLKYYVSRSVYAFDPLNSVEIDCSQLIRRVSLKRSHLIEKAKEANIIGVLVGTLSVKKYLEAVNFARKLIKSAGKKCYTFVVGKINVPKLANFAEIDAFVLISCAESALNDHSEFFKPVMSLCELNYALNEDNSQWDGSFDLDFANIVDRHQNDILSSDEQDEVPQNIEESNNLSVSVRGDRAVVPNTAAAFLNQRSWKGLEVKLGQTEVCKIEPGLSGIPVKYDQELKN